MVQGHLQEMDPGSLLSLSWVWLSTRASTLLPSPRN
ncbi:hypothetical protein LINGRAPRIM_LOCUS494 [Linum grandiflorum]